MSASLNGRPRRELGLILSQTPEERAHDERMRAKATIRDVHEIANELAQGHIVAILGPYAQTLKQLMYKVAYLEDKLGVTQEEFDAWFAAQQEKAKAEAEAAVLPETPPESGDIE